MLNLNIFRHIDTMYFFAVLDFLGFDTENQLRSNYQPTFIHTSPQLTCSLPEVWKGIPWLTLYQTTLLIFRTIKILLMKVFLNLVSDWEWP